MQATMKASLAASLTPMQLSEHFQIHPQEGMMSINVLNRQITHGINSFDLKGRDSLCKKYFEQFTEPMILLLLISAIISLFMGQFDDALSITVAIVIVVTVAFIQGYQSEKAIEALKKLLPPMCHCVRDGHLQTLPAKDLVPGDIIYLETGDRVPADIRLLEAIELCVDESSFTGEMKPVVKDVIVCASIQGDHTMYRNMVYSGTYVRSGSGKGIVIATGYSSEFGELFKMMQQEEVPRTPLQKRMDHLGKQLTVFSFTIIAMIVLIGVFQGRHLLELFTVAVSLGVAAIPEGLPIVVTVTLAIGQKRMANRNAIVKKLPAVETLGCVNIVCCDKTGTLTKNEMTVSKVVTSEHKWASVTGIGYNFDGAVIFDDNANDASNKIVLEHLATVACVCNNATFSDGQYHGQPTEAALLCFSAKAKIFDARHSYTRIREWPFSSDSKIMIVKCLRQYYRKSTDNNALSSLYFLKGAPEIVIERCTHFYFGDELQPMTFEKRELFLQDARHLGERGLRIIALAQGMQIPEEEHLSELNCVYYGMLGMLDPPRDNVYDSIGVLAQSGVRVAMITGDAKDTACSIGKELGLYRGGELCWSGNDIDDMSIAQMSFNIQNVAIFYRTNPKHKIKIVKALQEKKLVVAMTGDGVNDAVALKGADIGIAMGRSGTDVCKEASDIVLVDDDFSTILAAMEEGKSIFFNIRNFVRFQLSTSIAALSLIAFSTLFKLPNPLNPMQILWINILMDGPPAQSLGVEPVDEDIIKLPPRSSKEQIINKRLLINIILSAIIILMGTLFVYLREMSADNQVTPRDTTMTFTCFVFFDMFNALSSRSQIKSIFTIGIAKNRVFLIAVSLSIIGQMLVIYFRPLQSVFQTEALSLGDLIYLLLFTSSLFWIFELKKLIDNSKININKLVGKLTLMSRPWNNERKNINYHNIEELNRIRIDDQKANFNV